MTPGERANLRRLGQVATLAERRWAAHEASCDLCAEDDEYSDEVCAEGVALYMLATAYRCAVLTMQGRMVWR
jgi:hypothetical protein